MGTVCLKSFEARGRDVTGGVGRGAVRDLDMWYDCERCGTGIRDWQNIGLVRIGGAKNGVVRRAVHGYMGAML